MYKCERCDWTGSASELGYYTEYRGECHGAPAWETLPCCPECGYDVENIEEEKKKRAPVREQNKYSIHIKYSTTAIICQLIKQKGAQRLK